ncbi:MAG: nucleotidyl transferase AbiEii/AbiGii toxin family protein [Bacteroidales bacterium]|nr:nucleotidyl transferase AbiEii/AbiGii toxin family protein [Bacteroidales bacterium]
MLHLQTALPDTLELLKELSSRPEMSGLRLVGGTALALQYGHRQSVDLDFFGTPAVDQEALIDMFSSIGGLSIHNRNKRILQVVVRNIKVDVVDYSQYSWVDEPMIEDRITLASPRDIAAMKINAIEGRGSCKDFVDIYFLLQHYTLTELLDFYAQKYPNHSFFRALLSLTYFDDAEQQAMPKMFSPVDWDEIKSLITSEVRKIQR